MTKTEFHIQWLRFHAVFGKDDGRTDDERLAAEREYWGLFSGYPDDQFRRAVDILLREVRFKKIPLPKEIFNALAHVDLERGYASAQDLDALKKIDLGKGPTCRFCNDTGWAAAETEIVFGREYETVYRCGECELGRRCFDAWQRRGQELAEGKYTEKPKIYDGYQAEW